VRKRLVALVLIGSLALSCGANEAVQRDETQPSTKLPSPPHPTLTSSDFQQVHRPRRRPALFAKADPKQPLRLRVSCEGHGLYLMLPATSKP